MVIQWWSNIQVKKRFIVLITLIISGLIFWSLTFMQNNSILINNRFCKDLVALFISQILDNIEFHDDQKIVNILEKIYLKTESIKYIMFFRIDGSLLFSLPVYSDKINSLLKLDYYLVEERSKDFLFYTLLVKSQYLLSNNITQIIVPLIKNGKKLGSINLGINLNIYNNLSSYFIYQVSIFICIWLIVMIVFIFNFLTIIEPTKKLLFAIQNISLGKFNQRIQLMFDSEFNELMLSFNDMAERLEYYEKKNLEKLVLEKNKFESILSTIADGAILVDAELRLLFANQIAVKTFDWINLDISGKDIRNYLPLHVSKSLLPIFNSLVKCNCFDYLNSQTKEICIHINSNSNKIFRFLLTPILDKNNKVLFGIAIIMQDISREIQLNEAKNIFIGNVSHELRTPLCNIGSFLETLLDYNNSLNATQKKYFLTIANNETKRLACLVNDILDLSRLESEFDYTFVEVDLVQILYAVVKTSQLIAEKNYIELILEIDPVVKFVLGNESLLFQVISNLVSNAIKFTSQYGQIVLRAYALFSLSVSTSFNNISFNSINIIRVEIIDEGIGIDKKDQKVIFDRFVRVEQDVHTLQGTGLGLSIVKNILNKHNSRLILASNLSVGTSLCFDLFVINT
uniref:Uncharacterized sensor-like histidine kinase ycf26 n=1 Tax=Acrosorium ciliolatum TaxID=1550622 RepID=A0A1Z1M2B0_9FLOR|nr:Drug sensory protein A [Acrosorium ciliolatum]ARW59933.1 Drug sensory protein A [Acrosorium ciliolatum]